MGFPVIRSLLSVVAETYDIGDARTCSLLVRGLNDTYRVRTEAQSYILRVYRAHWRTTADILYELDLLRYLGERGAAVSTPISRKDNSLAASVEAPEGHRYFALFTHAPGHPAELTIEYASSFGRAMAVVHSSSTGFSTGNERFALDLNHLVREPLRLARPRFSGRFEEWAYLATLAETICNRITALADRGLDWGPCHGDATERNAHRSDDGLVTLFDFDCGGPGWRAYDLATFLMEARKHRQADTLWAAYLPGYAEYCPMSASELEAVPLFLAARYFWSLGLALVNEPEYIGDPLDDAYIDRMVAYLRKWEAERISTYPPDWASPTLYRGY